MPGGEYSHVPKQAPEPVKQVSGVFISRLPVVFHARRAASPPFLSRAPHLYTCRRPLPLYPHSLIVSSAIPVGEIFPCKGTAVVRSSSTAVLTGSWICTAAFPNQRSPFSPPPCHARRVGYSMKSPAVFLAFPSFPRCLTCM